MLKLTLIFISVVLTFCSAAPTTTPAAPTTPRKKISCLGHADHLLADPDDRNKYHQCSHGQDVATLHCFGNLVFDPIKETCMFDPNHKPEAECPRAEGLFKFPGNPHKFIDCHEGHGSVIVCPTDLVFDENLQICTFNDQGQTWPTDPTTTPKPTTAAATKATEAPTTKATAAPATKATGAPVTKASEAPATKATSGPTGTTSKACTIKGNFPEPTDKKKFHSCSKDGKLLTMDCPAGTEFDDSVKSCD